LFFTTVLCRAFFSFLMYANSYFFELGCGSLPPQERGWQRTANGLG